MSAGGPRPRIDILTPVFNEESNLPRYEREVGEVLLARPDYEFHVLFIDDGSEDRSWALIRELCGRDARYHGIRLSRNFGSHIALGAGFSRAHGDAVVTLACDLQDPPEVILEFLERWKSGAHVVWGHRRNRQDGVVRAWTSRRFASLIRRHAMPKGSRFTTGSFLLADRKVAEGVGQFPERNRITFALVAWTGFQQDVVLYDRKPRLAGRSGWTYPAMIKAMYDTFVGFSALPIRVLTALGLGIFAFTLALSGYVVYSLWFGHPLPGWSGIMLTLSSLFGLQFLALGVMGEYLYRIYAEVVRRPLFFVQEEAPATERPRPGA